MQGESIDKDKVSLCCGAEVSKTETCDTGGCMTKYVCQRCGKRCGVKYKVLDDIIKKKGGYC